MTPPTLIGLHLDAKSGRRFWSKVLNTSTCWLWVGSIGKNGYGIFSLRYKNVYAHRVAWVSMYGDIPEGMCVLHRCDNPRCCRPAHLFLGTHADNARDRERKGRRQAPAGENHYGVKLTEKDVEVIRQSLGRETVTTLASRFHVSPSTISAVRSGRTWKRRNSGS